MLGKNNDFYTAMSHFTGSTGLYKHPRYKTPQYTDGVHYFLNNAGQGAYWLLDIIATEPAIRGLAEQFASITLVVTDNKAVLTAGDGNGRTAYTQTIDYTDCPSGTWKFYWTDDVLMVASEY